MKTIFTTGLLNALNLSKIFNSNIYSFNLSKFFSSSTAGSSSSNLLDQFLSEKDINLIKSNPLIKKLGIKDEQYKSLELKDGEYKYLHNLNLPKNIMWNASVI